MAVQAPRMVQHGLPLWSELLGAAIIGAAILLGVLLAAGHSDILPWNTTERTPTTSSWMMDDPAPIPPWAR